MFCCHPIWSQSVFLCIIPRKQKKISKKLRKISVVFCCHPIWSQWLHCGTQSTAWKSYSVTAFYFTAAILYYTALYIYGTATLSYKTFCSQSTYWKKLHVTKFYYTATLHHTTVCTVQTINLVEELLTCH